MADYFDEMNFAIVENNDEHQMLLLARFLRDYGFLEPTEVKTPPASKEIVKNLNRRKITEDSESEQCPICLATYKEGDIIITLPCSHEYHDRCILPWLDVTNSCPKCRFELKTDDNLYEENKKFRKRAADRDQDIEHLHNSMFS